jgi:hypothetical protein
MDASSPAVTAMNEVGTICARRDGHDRAINE